jgi:propanediol dehydratase small subunit
LWTRTPTARAKGCAWSRISRASCWTKIAAAKKAKALRHSVTRLTLRAFAAGKLLDARDTRMTAERPPPTTGRGRNGGRNILVRNLHRAQEAVRVLEEFCAPGTEKAGFKKTRFEL